MGNTVFFAPIRTPVVDPATNLMNREWYLFFQALWLRTGGTVAPSSDDILQNPDTTVNLSEALAGDASVTNLFSSLPTSQPTVVDQSILEVVAGLRDQVAELTKDIQELRQNPSL